MSDNIERTPVFNSIYDKIRAWVQEGNVIDKDNILDFTLNIIAFVEKIVSNKGNYKKNLVIQLITKLVDELNYPDLETKNNVKDFIDKYLPHFIDISISLARGEIDLGKKLRKCSSSIRDIFRYTACLKKNN